MKINHRVPWKVVYLVLAILTLVLAVGAPETLPW